MIEHEMTGQALGLCPPSKHPTALVRVMNFSRAACGSQRQREGDSERNEESRTQMCCMCLSSTQGGSGGLKPLLVKLLFGVCWGLGSDTPVNANTMMPAELWDSVWNKECQKRQRF